MENKNEFVKNCLDLVKTIVEKTQFHTDGIYFYESCDRNKLDAIIDYSFKTTLKLYKRIDDELPMQVYCEDLVVLSIDGGKPTRYFLTEYYDQLMQKPVKGVDTEYGNSTAKYVMIDAKKQPWCDLLDAHVGDTITYKNDGDEHSHTIDILSTRRTKQSTKLTTFDLDCAYTNEEINRTK